MQTSVLTSAFEIPRPVFRATFPQTTRRRRNSLPTIDELLDTEWATSEHNEEDTATTVVPTAVTASSTRWATIMGILHVTNPYAPANVLSPNPALVWDSGQTSGAVLLHFEFDGPRTTTGVVVQHAIFRSLATTSMRRDQEGEWRAVEVWSSSLDPRRIDRFEGRCFDRGWTVLAWPETLTARRLVLRIVSRGPSHIALRRVRFLSCVRSKKWLHMPHFGE